jgi:response regulator NasT
MTAAALRWANESPALLASAVPTVILDRRFRICGVNRAYEEVSLRRGETLAGEEVFDAFPDNPADPAGAGSARLLSSFEQVLRSRNRHHLGLLRYDIADPDDLQFFLTRVWSSVNSPILDNGRVVGLMQQVEDVTAVTSGRSNRLCERGEEGNELAVALAAANATVATLEEENEQLREALLSSRAIGVAIGLLMERHSLSRERALAVLRVRSQHSNRKLRDVAQEMADTGDLPTRRARLSPARR